MWRPAVEARNANFAVVGMNVKPNQLHAANHSDAHIQISAAGGRCALHRCVLHTACTLHRCVHALRCTLHTVCTTAPHRRRIGSSLLPETLSCCSCSSHVVFEFRAGMHTLVPVCCRPKHLGMWVKCALFSPNGPDDLGRAGLDTLLEDINVLAGLKPAAEAKVRATGPNG